LKEQNP